MARTSGFRQIDRGKLTPFARQVYAYMLATQPSKTVSELAVESGVSNNAIWSWLKYDIIPRRSTVIHFASKTRLDVDELLRAAGLPDTTVDDAERRRDMRVFRLIVKRIERELDADTRIPARDRATFLDWLHSHSALIAAGIGTADEATAALSGSRETPGEASASAGGEEPATPDDARARRRTLAKTRA